MDMIDGAVDDLVWIYFPYKDILSNLIDGNYGYTFHDLELARRG